MSNPQVSVIMPAFNAGSYVAAAVHSVIGQELTEWELIVINDGSTDNTADILVRIRDPRVQVIHQKNRGVSAARNVGLNASKGEFITFLDADDILPRESLLRRVEYLAAHPEIDLVNGHISVMNMDLSREIRRYIPVYTGPLFPALIRLDESAFMSGFYMFRHRALGNLRFRQDVTHGEDLIFFLEMADRTSAIIGNVNEKVYIYRRHPGGAMKNLNGLEQGYVQLLGISQRLQRVSPANRRFLRRRVALIMVKSWLRGGRPDKAIGALARIIFAQ